MKRDKVINRALSIFFTILSLAWIYPVFMIALNSFKKATAISTTTAFDLLTPETFNGLANYMHALNPVQVFFKIVLPIMKPTYLSVGILETMWVWNDYLLPYLTLDSTKYKTIPILIQYFRGGYGHVELGPMMACIMMVVIPIVIMYILCQKYIIDGVVAGAVKG